MNQTEGNGKQKVPCLTQGTDVLFEGAIFFGNSRASENQEIKLHRRIDLKKFLFG